MKIESIKKIALTLSLCLGIASIASAQTISQQEWAFSEGTVQADSGWLSLTRAHEPYRTANIQSKKTFTPSEAIQIEFDYISWGGHHAAGEGGDGIALYLFDTSHGGAGLGGHHSGALGYCGVNGGYIGIGLDEYGTFSGSCEKPARDGLSVRGASIRGSQGSNFAFNGSFAIKTPLDCAKCQTRQQAIDAGGVKHVVAQLTPKSFGPGYTVNLSINGEAIIKGADYPYAAPASMKLGLSASNGGDTNHHEIRNLRVSTPPVVVAPGEWDFSKGAVPTDSDWWSLTRAHESYTTGNVQSKKVYAPEQALQIEFDYISWGGKHEGGEGGDGLAIYMFDTSRGGAGRGGYHSSALGYCRLNGGYVGIGLDEYGNFSSSCEKQRTDGVGVLGATIRGADTRGFAFKESFPVKTALDCATCETRQQAIETGLKRVVAELTPKKTGPGYTIRLSINGETIISAADYPYAAPASMKIGVSASNGGQTNHHEIRGLRVLTLP